MHEQYLTTALALAEIKRGFCAPNPAVGAVVVKNNQILATGYHTGPGLPHAEVAALTKIGDEAVGATIYVTLEPCCHWGRTPPCVDLLIQRGITCVVYAANDPNPQVAGKSKFLLEQAGIKTIYLPLKEIENFYKSYIHWWCTKKPLVTAKIALSLDGKIAGANGSRINITGSNAQLFTHQQRKRADAILTTAKTIQQDNPLLNVRLNNQILSKPIYILDRRLTTSLTANIFSTAAKLTFFYQTDTVPVQLETFLKKGIRCVPVTADSIGLDLTQILTVIGQDGVHDLWVEAGGRCWQSFLQQKLLNRTFIYVAPKWLGATAQTAMPALTDIDFSTIAQTCNWHYAGHDAICEINL